MQEMNNNLNMSNNKIINAKNAKVNSDAVNLQELNEAASTVADSVARLHLKRDGSTLLAGNLNLNNNKEVNMAIPTDKNDSTNISYVDQKIGQSHISSHENRTNVLKYATDTIGELCDDFRIEVDSLKTDFNQMPHSVRKNAFAIDVLKKRMDQVYIMEVGIGIIYLFKLIRDNFSQNYTCCIEIYVPDSHYDNEFNSSRLSFQGLNININYQAVKKISNQYHNIRAILNLSPDGTSQSIQRRLYVDFKSTFDNSSPTKLRIYDIKNDALHNLDQSIYDWEKAYVISSNEKFTMYMPVDMNGFDILKTSNYLHGYQITNLSDKTFVINGSKGILLPSRSLLFAPNIFSICLIVGIYC